VRVFRVRASSTDGSMVFAKGTAGSLVSTGSSVSKVEINDSVAFAKGIAS